jgi:hypothetical protein
VAGVVDQQHVLGLVSGALQAEHQAPLRFRVVDDHGLVGGEDAGLRVGEDGDEVGEVVADAGEAVEAALEFSGTDEDHPGTGRVGESQLVGDHWPSW